MSALPCTVADPFAAADQAYATITEFLHSKEACQVKHSELERQLEGMGRELMRKLLQAHLDMRQPGQGRSNRCAMPRARRSRPLPYMGAVWRASSALWRWPAPATEQQAHPACTLSTPR